MFVLWSYTCVIHNVIHDVLYISALLVLGHIATGHCTKHICLKTKCTHSVMTYITTLVIMLWHLPTHYSQCFDCLVTFCSIHTSVYVHHSVPYIVTKVFLQSCYFLFITLSQVYLCCCYPSKKKKTCSYLNLQFGGRLFSSSSRVKLAFINFYPKLQTL